jgi:hypothetical protein
MISALFVQENGAYYNLPGVDPWPEWRDARNYAGPWPVVAHPPCQLWGPFAAVNYKRWGGEHNRPGNDGGCFSAAIGAAYMYGGVVEHPALSRAWAKFNIPQPKAIGWVNLGDGSWTCEVWQSAYGHRANKATRLWYCGRRRPIELDWSRPIGTHQIGQHDQRGKAKNKPTVTKREASATPPAFRDALIAIARGSR